MHTPGKFGLTLLIPAIIGGGISLAIGWEFWHGTAFTTGVVALFYSVSVWMGAEPWLRLEAPIIGLPIILSLGAILWWAHFGLNEVRPVTLMIQIVTPAPFVALVVFGLLGLE